MADQESTDQQEAGDPPTADPPSSTDGQIPGDPKAPAAAEDEQHRKFREALARKNAHHAAIHTDGNRNSGVRESRNDKQQREFRRKSG